MTEITGGTWEYHPETESVIATVEGDRFDIAQVSMYETGLDIEATNANGYAIAAIPEMLAALDTIAGGHTSRFPGAPDVMKAASPEAFQSAMWNWSQKVARAALRGKGA